jgi:hypothetical protein
MVTKDEVIKEYVRAVIEGYAAVFAGAGLSRGSGYTNWKDLVRPLAKEIGLDVDKEHDLIAIAQYYKNERGTRSGINQRILNEFTKDTKANANIDILTRLPISTYWTTNYDELIEESLKTNNRKADIKTTQASLAENIYDRDAIVYKMHGDVRCPSKAVITKDDYEIYGVERPLFRTALQGDLISKTFLFIGFSFEDPNLDYILSQIRILLGESTRDHYCFFENVKQLDNESEHDFQYRVVKQEHRIKDLKRYGIQAILLDSYSEITEVLTKVEKQIKLKNVFISGSLTKAEIPWTDKTVKQFMYLLASKIVEHDYRITSGFGEFIGSTVINGALAEIFNSKYKHINEHLLLRPFPQLEVEFMNLDELWHEWRVEMIGDVGICIFAFGNKMDSDDNIVISDGMIKEFEIAKSMEKIIVPVGSTGGASKLIYGQVIDEIDKYPYLKPFLDDLINVTNPETLIDIIFKIIINQNAI